MQISEAGGKTITDDLFTMFSSVDQTLLDTARLATSIMETNKVSTVPPARLQRVLDAAATGFAKMVEGRKDMVNVHKSLAVLKNASNLDVYDYGCPREVFESIFMGTPETVTA